MKDCMIGEYPIVKVQQKMLQILIEVDRICRKHHIKYSLEGGTLLGAVKYKSFVPWDDDIDIVMIRSEYEKFFKVCKRELNHHYFLQNNRILYEFPPKLFESMPK